MNVTVVRMGELTGGPTAHWSELQGQDAALASPFFHPEFTAAVDDVRNDVYVSVLEDGGTPMGFFPFQRGRLPVGAPVGGGRSNYHGVIAPADADWEPISLVRASGLRIWDFHHLPASQVPFGAFFATTGDSYCIDISEGFDAYARARREAGSRMIPRMREKARRMERELGALRLVPHDGDSDVLRATMAWKSRQYQRTGIVDNFSIPWNVNLLERLQATQTDSFGGMLVALYAGDELVAVDMGLRSRHVFHSWFPAYNEDLGRYSPGLVLFLLLLEQAESLGVRMIDLGKDHAPYKERMATGVVLLGEGSVLVPSTVATARRARRTVEGLIRRTPLSGPARGALRRVRSLRIGRRLSTTDP